MSERKHSEPVARQLLIVGRVQGVWYRASAEQEATRLGLSGWVRNTRDGSVEALVAGAEEAVEAFVDWARQGPPAAKVERIEIAAGSPPETAGFRVLPDA